MRDFLRTLIEMLTIKICSNPYILFTINRVIVDFHNSVGM